MSAYSQLEEPLYKGPIPNSREAANEETREESGGKVRIGKISVPTITAYLPAKDKATGTAVIIFPGGGYSINAIQHEGHDVARRLNQWGIAAFVVKYRIPDPRTMPDPSIGPLQDAQQAMITVRQNATRWGLDSNRIGIMGFSAGGHLASTLGTHFEKILVDNPAGTRARPDFMVLVYPVISSDSTIWHRGSFLKLLGPQATGEQLHLYSNERQVNAQTPPTFLLHASDDKVVPVANSLRFYEALRRYEVPAEMHIYERGGHGFGMNNSSGTDQWMQRLHHWLYAHHWVNP